MSDDDLPEIRSALVEQADDIIDENTTAIDLVAQLDVSRYRHRDSSGDRGKTIEFEPIFKAVLLRELEDWPDTKRMSFRSLIVQSGIWRQKMGGLR